MRMELKITGEADDPRAVAQAAIDAAAWAGMGRVVANVSYGNTQGVAVSPEEGEQEQASVMAVSFASSKGARLADELNVPASAFDGVVPSGKRGFTVGDVRALAGR